MLGGSLDGLNVAFSILLPGQSHLKIDLRADSVNGPFIPLVSLHPSHGLQSISSVQAARKKGGPDYLIMVTPMDLPIMQKGQVS